MLVDEYQDVNACQDALFRLLSDNGRKLFMVGDVKQSIYRFRLADPTIFLKKIRDLADIETAEPCEEPGRILLRENFRSRPEVLESANHVFRNIMSRELGELEYDEAAALRPGPGGISRRAAARRRSSAFSRRRTAVTTRMKPRTTSAPIRCCMRRGISPRASGAWWTSAPCHRG